MDSSAEIVGVVGDVRHEALDRPAEPELFLPHAQFGVVIGVLLALPLTQLLRAFLFGVTPLDPLTFLSVVIGFVAIAAAACYIPARRAVRVDPAKALRFD
jgi:hypothetical protein